MLIVLAINKFSFSADLRMFEWALRFVTLSNVRSQLAFIDIIPGRTAQFLFFSFYANV